MYQHKTKDGQVLRLSELTTTHLQNIINNILKKSEEGFTGPDGFLVYGEEAKEIMGYRAYMEEYKRRRF